MSRPRKISPAECGPFPFGVSRDIIAKALCPKLDGVNPALVDLLYRIEWHKDRVKCANEVVIERRSIPKHLRKRSQRFAPVLSGERIEVGKLHPLWPGRYDELDDLIEARDSQEQGVNLAIPESSDNTITAKELENLQQIVSLVEAHDEPRVVIPPCQLDNVKWQEPVHAMSNAAKVVEVDELDDAIEARDLHQQELNVAMADFHKICTSGKPEVLLQIAAITEALKGPRPLSFLVLQPWLPGNGKSKAGEITKQVNEWLRQDGRDSEMIQPGNEKTITNALIKIGLPYPEGKNKKPRN